MKKNVCRFLLFALASMHVVSCSNFSQTVSFKRSQSKENGYRRAVRSLDGKSFYFDFIEEGLAYDDEVECSSIQNYFYNDGKYYDYDQLDELIEQTVSMAQDSDPEAELFIPDELEVFSDDVVVTSFDGFQTIYNGDIEEEIRKTQIGYMGYIDDDSSDYNYDDEYDETVNHNTKILNVFVPGIGGDSTHWTNNGLGSDHIAYVNYHDENRTLYSQNSTIYLRKDSLPNSVKEYYSSDAYVIRPEFTKGEKLQVNKCAKNR